MKKRGPVFESVLQRSRLVAPILEDASIVTIEAPVGFGKTTLLRQLVAASDGVYVGNGDDVEMALGRLDDAPLESVLVAVDDANELIEDAVRLASHESIQTLVLADRYLPPELLALAEQYDNRHLSASDLRLTESEMQELAEQLAPVSGTYPPTDGPPDLAEHVAYVLGPTSEGWPIAATWMLRRAFAGGDPLTTARELAYPGPDSDAFVQENLGGLDPQIREAIERLAHFDAFTGACIDTLVGQDGVARARRAGAPLLAGERSWFRLPRPVSRPLQVKRPLDVSTAQLLAPVLIASGGILAGLRALIKAGCTSDAAETLAGLAAPRFDEVDQQGLVDVVATLRTEHDAAHLALIEARAQRNLGRHEASDRCLDACLEMGSAEWVDDPVNAEVVLGARIDRLFGRAFSPNANSDSEIAELRSLIRGHMSPALGLRLDEIDALLRGQMADPAVVHQACDDVLDVAKRWENLGEISRAAMAIRRISASGLSHLGRYNDAIKALEHAHELTWHRLKDRTINIMSLCRVRVIAAELDGIDPMLRESWALAEVDGESWVRSYLHWTEAILASRRNDLEALPKSLAEAAREMGALLDHETGVVFRCEAALAYAEVGLLDEAAAELALVADRVAVDHVDFGLAAAAVAARRGDRAAVDSIIADLTSGGRLPPGRAWRARLEASIAADLGGDSEGALRLRSGAVAEAERFGQGRLAALLLQRAPTKVGAEPVAPSGLRISVLGDCQIERAGEPVEVPDGHVMVLLKLLAVSDGPVPIEVVFAALWPDTDVATCRRRIKNIVSRLRALVGNDHVIRAHESMALAASVDIDLRQFTDRIRAALRATPGESEAVTHLKEALELYQGQVLPADLYDDWAIEARQAAKARALTALDHVFDLEPAQRPSAAWLLDVVLRIDPSDDTRLLRITRQALAENLPACARAALERALAAAQDLGVSLEDEIQDLRFLLKTA